MARWENFSVWKGRFPHWRAEGVEYYVSFPHRRALTPDQCLSLFGHLMRAHGRHFTYIALVVTPEKSEAVLAVEREGTELNDVLVKAQKRFVKGLKDDGRYFYAEPYDRIIRDEEEREAFLEGILKAGDSAVEQGAHEWEALFVATGEPPA